MADPFTAAAAVVGALGIAMAQSGDLPRASEPAAAAIAVAEVTDPSEHHTLTAHWLAWCAADPAVATIAARMRCSPDDVGLPELTDGSRLAETDRPGLVRFAQLQDVLVRNTLDLARRHPLRYPAHWVEQVRRADQRRISAQAELYLGRISWGQYQQLRRHFDRDWREALLDADRIQADLLAASARADRAQRTTLP